MKPCGPLCWEGDPASIVSQAVEQEMSKPERLRDSTTQGIANIMWSFATLRFYPARFMTAACVALEHRLQECNDQELSNCLWAVARLAHHPGPSLMIRFCQALDALVLLCPLLFDVPFWAARLCEAAEARLLMAYAMASCLCAQAHTHIPSKWCNSAGGSML